MEIFLSIIGVAIVGMLGFLIWKQQTSAVQTDDTALQAKDEKIGELKTELKSEQSEKNKLVGENKKMSEEVITVREEQKSLRKEITDLKQTVAEYKATETQREKDYSNKLQQLTNAQKGFDDEKVRVQREDAEKLAQLEAERDRMWADHEATVISKLNDLCKLHPYAFTTFTNKSLPEKFLGNFAPDFMIEFLGQYVIFDAKVSKAEGLQTYINNAVKTTAEKIRKNGNSFFPIVFLVVPTQAIGELKKTHYYDNELIFFVISPEALPPILFSLKRITTYELADKFDPQQRENIINMLADMDFQIRLRNGTDLVLTKLAINTLSKVQQVDPELDAAIALKRQERVKKLPNIMDNAMKKLVNSVQDQQDELTTLTAPKALVQMHDMQKGEEIILQSQLEG